MVKKVKRHIIPVFLLLAAGQIVMGAGGGRKQPPADERPLSDTAGIPAVTPAPAPVVRDTNIIDIVSPKDSLFQEDTVIVKERHPGTDTAKKKNGAFLEEPISGHNKDSLVYDLRAKTVYIYTEGDVNYQNMNIKADFMRIRMDTKDIYAYGYTDSLGNKTRPQFTEGNMIYTMDTVTYNINSKKAKIKGVATKEGEAYLIGDIVKTMPDNTINIAHGKYTTCDQVDHPHFYLAMTKSKTIPGKKTIVGPSYLVMEDVPIYFLGVPFGFFPMNNEKNSGFIIPKYGEEAVKGFFIRDGGYYFKFNDYIDLQATAGIYTLGSWEAAVSSRYLKRYKYSGSFSTRYSKDIIGEKGEQNYVNQNSYSIGWTHTQDPKFRPSSNFSASVNFMSSGYSKYGSTTMDDYLTTQTNSSISYSKSWPGRPYSFSTNLSVSQNSNTKTMMLSFPNASFNITRIYPFKRRNAVGKQRWYEKIYMTYNGNLRNSVTAPENEMFTEAMLKKMQNSLTHSIPVGTSFNLFNYLNITPSVNYNEQWHFQKNDRTWDPAANQVKIDTTYGFYRTYGYSAAVSTSTKLYGTFLFPKTWWLQGIRHVMTPSASFSYTPDFTNQKYGFLKPVQTDSLGTISYYSPYRGVSPSGQSAAISFSLGNTLEMKHRSDKDTSGVKKVKLIDNFSLSSSYNFLADSLNLSPFSLNLRLTLPINNFGFNISATLDPYQLDPVTHRKINKFMISKGKLGRITSTGWSFGYTFKSRKSNTPAVNDINSGVGNVPPEYANMYDPNANLDPNTRRVLMTQQYYDFSIPWNFGFNYSVSYSNPAGTANIQQTLGFNGSFSLTPAWGITFNGGFDFVQKKITPGVVTINRDLHCWQMNLTWVPIGYRKSWSFTIGVKSAMLSDLKWDKSSSHYDNLYDQ